MRGTGTFFLPPCLSARSCHPLAFKTRLTSSKTALLLPLHLPLPGEEQSRKGAGTSSSATMSRFYGGRGGGIALVDPEEDDDDDDGPVVGGGPSMGRYNPLFHNAVRT